MVPPVAVALLLWAALAVPWAFVIWPLEPYMDELFHVPQAQGFCRGDFALDPKITTPPGLHLMGAALALACGQPACPAAALRALNLLFGAGSLLVLERLLRRRMGAAKAAAHALLLSLYPVHFFFQLLFYSDVGALFWALLAHDLATPAPGRALPSRPCVALAAVAGLAGLLFRQTNAVWMLVTLGTAALADLELSKEWREGLARAPGLRLVGGLALTLLREAPRLLLRLGPLLLPPLLLLSHSLWSGSVALGDKAMHQPSPHWAQLCYLLAAASSLWGLVGPGSALSELATFWAFCRARPFRACAAAALCALVLRRYSLAHPFLLADNRHYTFYAWRRLLAGMPGLKEALSPAYLYCLFLCSRRLVAAQSWLWFLGWLVAAALSAVPAPLLEPRYWTPAVILAHAHAPEQGWSALCVGAVACALVNIATLAVFAFRPFTWPDGSVARFMW